MSLTARIDRLRRLAQDTARDAVHTGVRIASPVVGAATSRVRDRLRGPGAVPAPAPAAPATRQPAPATGTSRRTAPNPASVARNIAPHPPAPKPKPAARRSTPSGKLPPRRQDED